MKIKQERLLLWSFGILALVVTSPVCWQKLRVIALVKTKGLKLIKLFAPKENQIPDIANQELNKPFFIREHCFFLPFILGYAYTIAVWHHFMQEWFLSFTLRQPLHCERPNKRQYHSQNNLYNMLLKLFPEEGTQLLLWVFHLVQVCLVCLH